MRWWEEKSGDIGDVMREGRESVDTNAHRARM